MQAKPMISFQYDQEDLMNMPVQDVRYLAANSIALNVRDRARRELARRGELS